MVGGDVVEVPVVGVPLVLDSVGDVVEVGLVVSVDVAVVPEVVVVLSGDVPVVLRGP